jgi:hypothetical protein|tara:strand:+ start:402 stop:770 length:369 start_codon:yes stop_codon:yes gene_type:complete
VIRVATGTILFVVMLGCQTVEPDYDKPARIINVDDASRSALQNAVNTAIGTNVTLADNALTDTSLLTLENRPPRSMTNPNPQGRIMEMPIQFQLIKNGNDCILINQRDRSRQVLSGTSCEAE